MELHNGDGTKYDLAQYRLEIAKSDLKSAKLLLDADEYRGANNKDYIHTEVFPKEYGRRIAEAEEIRHASDYDDFYVATKAEVEKQIETAVKLTELIEQYCKEDSEDEKVLP